MKDLLIAIEHNCFFSVTQVADQVPWTVCYSLNTGK